MRSTGSGGSSAGRSRSEEHTSELQSRVDLVCRLLLEKKKRSGGSGGSVGTDKIRGHVRVAKLLPDLPDPLDLLDPGEAAIIFFNYTATTEIYTLSLHDALPI